MAALGRSIHVQDVIANPHRGIIRDRNGGVLAANSNDYQVGVSPSLIVDSENIATTLAPVLQIKRRDILDKLNSEHPYELLAGRVSAEAADAIRETTFADDIQLDAMPIRIYPQGELMCHLLGYTDYEGVGGAGIEGGLASGAVVVVDEAGMVGTRQLAAVGDLVEQAAGKLILVGDDRQDQHGAAARHRVDEAGADAGQRQADVQDGVVHLFRESLANPADHPIHQRLHRRRLASTEVGLEVVTGVGEVVEGLVGGRHRLEDRRRV
ncbi:MAG: AAA family ATPase, partial [Pseudomonadota bacterium]